MVVAGADSMGRGARSELGCRPAKGDAMHRSKQNTQRTTVFPLVLLVAGSACGSGHAELSQPSEVHELSNLGPAPDLSVQILVESGGYGKLGDPVRQSLTSALTMAGYQVRESTTPPPDVVLKIKLDTEAIRKTVWNGMSGGYRVKGNIRVVSYKAAESIDQTSIEFNAKEGQVDDNALRGVVVHISKTKRLHAYADRLKLEAANEEEAVWTGASVSNCRTAASKSACKGITAYLDRFQSGKHSDEAGRALTENIAAEEENSWENAVAQQCTKPRKSTDCVGVLLFAFSWRHFGSAILRARSPQCIETTPDCEFLAELLR